MSQVMVVVQWDATVQQSLSNPVNPSILAKWMRCFRFTSVVKVQGRAIAVHVGRFLLRASIMEGKRSS